jgi:predicted NUDIX family phosphoesterase
MTDKMAEKVLCISRKEFDRIGSFQGFQSEKSEQYLQLIHNPTYIARGLAEEDPSWKQIIPYLVVTQDGKILSYTRGSSGTEARLHAKISIGIGGHINDEDNDYELSLKRELEEELSLKFDDIVSNEMIGLINDDSNPVGQVHLGAAHLVVIPSDLKFEAGEVDLQNLEFRTIEDLQANRDRLETWSSIVLDAIIQQNLLKPATV